MCNWCGVLLNSKVVYLDIAHISGNFTWLSYSDFLFWHQHYLGEKQIASAQVSFKVPKHTDAQLHTEHGSANDWIITKGSSASQNSKYNTRIQGTGRVGRLFFSGIDQTLSLLGLFWNNHDELGLKLLSSHLSDWSQQLWSWQCISRQSNSCMMEKQFSISIELRLQLKWAKTCLINYFCRLSYLKQVN
jgi:hypothetical protein